MRGRAFYIFLLVFCLGKKQETMVRSCAREEKDQKQDYAGNIVK